MNFKTFLNPMMKTYLLPIFIIVLLWNCPTIQAQILDKIKNKVKDKAKDQAKNVANRALKDEIEEIRGGYDSTNVSYAIALSDNTGAFEDKEKFSGMKKGLLSVSDRFGITQNNDPLQDAKDLNALGQIWFYGTAYKKAENMFSASQKRFENQNGTSTIFYPTVIANKGLLYHTLGRFSEAEEFTKNALDLRKKLSGENSTAYAASLNNLAMLYKDEGKYNESEALINQALSITEKAEGKNSVDYAIFLNNKAMLFQTMGRFGQAEQLMQQAISLAEPLLREKSSNFQRLQVNLALLYQETGKYAEAEKLYVDAINVKERRLQANHPDLAHMKNLLASLYMTMNKYDKVEGLLTDAMKIYEKQFGKQHPSYAGTLSNLGTYHRVKGDPDKAEKMLKEALEIRRSALGEKHPLFSKSEEDLAMIYWQKGNYQEAGKLYKNVLARTNAFIREYFPPMSEAEKEKYWAKMHPTYLRFFAFASQFAGNDPSLSTEMYNAHLASKATLLSATNKIKQQILNSGNQELIRDYSTWLQQKESLAKLYTFTKEELKEREINRDSLENAANILEKKLSANALFAQGYEEKAVSYQDIVAKLEATEAMVDIIQFPKFDKVLTGEILYAALVTSKDLSAPKLVLMENGSELDKKYFAYYRNTIKNKGQDKFSYQQYWSKIDPLVANKSKLFVSLDGVYNQLSLNTLLKPDGKYLVDDKNIVILTSPKDLLQIRGGNKPTYSKQALLIGFPDYGTSGKIAALPGTKKEVDDIHLILTGKGFTSTKLLAKQAKEEQIKSLKSSPRVLHIATHGFFLNDLDDWSDNKVFGIDLEVAKENPLQRAGLLLADADKSLTNRDTREIDLKDNGVLTAYEAMNLPLDKTELVIMSACETGLGDVKAGEGVYGLQRAFHVAGSDALIMSLWTVSDAATQELMTLFYQNWIVSGDKAVAFKKAQQQLKTKYKEPYFWGAFVLIGT